MKLSIFDLFNIGVGPSSSHTVGPMRASNFFIEKLKKHEHFSKTTRVMVELYGSLSLTGKGHGTDRALIAGLESENPETTTFEKTKEIFERVAKEHLLFLSKESRLHFILERDLLFKKDYLPYHPNGMIFYAYEGSHLLYKKTFYSVGGGFIVGHKSAQADNLKNENLLTPYPFYSAGELLSLCELHQMSISDLTYQNELSFRKPERIAEKISLIWKTMHECMEKGFREDGVLPGRLGVKRRAKSMYERLCSHPEESLKDPLTIIDWVNLYALSVNEENAAGGRVVTAPTNGAAGIIPAVLMYYVKFCSSDENRVKSIQRFLLTAGAIGLLYKQNASISGAEVGCQGEVGVACSMAAAGLTEVLGGTPYQVENAAEIGMEHNLGLTCDPVDGQVQIPCIERNAMASVKAINAARIALRGSGHHFISLDKVMKTMKETGLDMQAKYKETSQGGLAVNVTAC